MSLPPGAVRRAGFTLIELLIVIVVIAILALIVIPRVTSANRKARESTLRENLHILRTAITHFSADTGLYPTALVDLSNPRSSPPANGVNDDNDTEVLTTGTYLGPYLNVSGGIGVTGIPINPFKHASDADFADPTAHWTYGVEGPGIVHAAIPTSGFTMDGLAYSEL
jgi:prepilin-type N-terminal cleavage/methylation domain-containing protein